VTQTGAITINQAGAIGAAGAGNTVGNGIYASIASGTAAHQHQLVGRHLCLGGHGLPERRHLRRQRRHGRGQCGRPPA
jgi:hypothetical protein